MYIAAILKFANNTFVFFKWVDDKDTNIYRTLNYTTNFAKIINCSNYKFDINKQLVF